MYNTLYQKDMFIKWDMKFAMSLQIYTLYFSNHQDNERLKWDLKFSMLYENPSRGLKVKTGK